MNIKQSISDLTAEINFLQIYQNIDGSILTENSYNFIEILSNILFLSKEIYYHYDLKYMADALEKDILDWISRSIHEKPCFDNTLQAFKTPKNNESFFLIAPIQTPNGPHKKKGFYLEFFIAQRSEPKVLEKIKEKYPHPKDECLSLKLNFSSKGFLENNCIVIFPENISTNKKVNDQNFAMFFYNKFYDIYHKETLRLVESKISYDLIHSKKLNRDETYIARSLWGYLHDLYHHKGKKPFHLHLYTKINFWVGILEEIKVDCQTIITLKEDDILFSNEIIEFILFERILRYPQQHDCSHNFDSATGLFLTSWLYNCGDIFQVEASGKVNINYDKFITKIKDLIAKIEDLEGISDDERYKDSAIQLIKKYIKIDISCKKVEVPNCYKDLFGIKNMRL